MVKMKAKTKAKRTVKKKTAKKSTVKKKTVKRLTANKKMKKVSKKPVKEAAKKSSKKLTVVQKKRIGREVAKHEAKRAEKEARDLFGAGEPWSFKSWLKRYSPILIPLGIGLLLYFYLVFFVFYPQVLVEGHYIKFLMFIMFLCLLGGLFMYFGMRTELLYARILSFILVFAIFSFLIMFLLLAHILKNGIVP